MEPPFRKREKVVIRDLCGHSVHTHTHSNPFRHVVVWRLCGAAHAMQGHGGVRPAQRAAADMCGAVPLPLR